MGNDVKVHDAPLPSEIAHGLRQHEVSKPSAPLGVAIQAQNIAKHDYRQGPPHQVRSADHTQYRALMSRHVQ